MLLHKLCTTFAKHIWKLVNNKHIIQHIRYIENDKNVPENLRTFPGAVSLSMSTWASKTQRNTVACWQGGGQGTRGHQHTFSPGYITPDNITFLALMLETDARDFLHKLNFSWDPRYKVRYPLQ